MECTKYIKRDLTSTNVQWRGARKKLLIATPNKAPQPKTNRSDKSNYDSNLIQCNYITVVKSCEIALAVFQLPCFQSFPFLGYQLGWASIPKSWDLSHQLHPMAFNMDSLLKPKVSKWPVAKGTPWSFMLHLQICDQHTWTQTKCP